MLIADDKSLSANRFHSFLEVSFSLAEGMRYHCIPFRFFANSDELFSNVTLPSFDLATILASLSDCLELNSPFLSRPIIKTSFFLPT